MVLKMYQKLTLNRISKIFTFLISFILCSSNVLAIVKPTDQFYVNDYANILSSETESYIINMSEKLCKVDGTQIVVVTVNNLEGETIESYAVKLFRQFGIGDVDKDNGLLLLLAYEEREFRVEVGLGLEGILPDGKTGRFQDQYIIPYLKNNQWDKGIKNGYDAFYNEIVELNNLDLETSNYETPVADDGKKEFIFIVITFFAPIIGMVCGLVAKNSFNSKKVVVRFWLGFFISCFSLLYSLFFSIPLLLAAIMFLLFLSENNIVFGPRNDYDRDLYTGGYSGIDSSSNSGSHHSNSGGGGISGGGGSTRKF